MSDNLPANGSKWRHWRGGYYHVIAVTNTEAVRDVYPVTVVYEDDKGRVWSRPMSEWDKSFNAEISNAED